MFRHGEVTCNYLCPIIHFKFQDQKVPGIFPYVKDPKEAISGCKAILPHGCFVRYSLSYRSDWTLDSTHLNVDVNDGWQYAKSFDDPDDQWSAELPPALERLFSRYSVFSPSLGVSPSSSSLRQEHASQSQFTWVRRRRWVRIMRRRLDITPLPFMQPDGSMCRITANGTLVPLAQDDAYDPEGGQELGAMPHSYLSFTQDYVARARYLAGSPRGTDNDSVDEATSAADVRKSIAKLEQAALELRAGMLSECLSILHFDY
jgi:hypothetical protein